MTTEKWLIRVCVLSLVGGIIHGAVTPDHFEEWWGYGLFFLLAALAQTMYGAVPLFSRMVEGSSVLERWSPKQIRGYAWAGIIGNASIIGLYVVTRTVGIPFFGPEAGVVEDVVALEVVSKVVEVLLVVGLFVLVRAPPVRVSSLA